MTEEPSYMMFARSNVRRGELTPPAVVKALVERIDRLEAEASKPAPKGYVRGQRVHHHQKGAGKVYQDQSGFHHVYVVFDDEPGTMISVDPNGLREEAK